MFGAIKPESLRLSKRQHLTDFFSWGTKDGTWDDTRGMLMRERDDYKKKGHRASIGPQHLGQPKDGKYARVHEVRYNRSAATLPSEIAALLDPRTPLP